MSASVAEPVAVADARAARPARALDVLVVAATFAALAGVVAILASVAGHPVDARAELERLFAPVELPHGLELARAFELAGGMRVVVAEDPAAGDEPAAAPAPEGGVPEDPTLPRFDWTKVPIGAVGSAPRRVVFLTDPERAAFEPLRAGGGPGVDKLGREGGVVAIEIGKLPWRDYDAEFVHERLYERGGTFRDTIRVALSANGRACSLLAEWTRGMPASKARVAEILARLEPRPRASEG